jgi:hypothetical protein
MFAALLVAIQSDALGLKLQAVDPARLRATVTKLASYPTRNSLSKEVHQAAAWLADEYRAIPGIEVELMEYTLPQGRRVPQPTPCVQVVATLKGSSPETIIIGAHLDSLNLSVAPTEGPAPGANDDASGVALTLELARQLAGTTPRRTIKFVAFTGEEQGLLGAIALAQRAKDENWPIVAMLNNDTVGSSRNLSGQENTKQVRVFSEKGDNHDSRELARFIEWTVRQAVDDFTVKLVLRRDRFGRGGDHTPFVLQGFSAVRFIEVHEEFKHQHTPDDLVQQMDFDYLANVTRANLAAVWSLAHALPAPTKVTLVRDQTHDTTLTWEGEPGVPYTVYWRDTASAEWQGSMAVGEVERATVPLVNKDDHIFAVGAAGGVPVLAE